MSNQIVKALEHAAQKLGRTLAEDAGKALKGFYRKAGDNMKRVAKNVREVEEKHAKDLAKIMRGEGKDGVPHPRSGGDRAGRPGRSGGRSRLRDGVAEPRRTAVPFSKRKCRSDPIDVASGEMVLPQQDLRLEGALPLVFSRTHVSSYRCGGWFGPSWASTLDQRVELDEDGVVFATEDGMLLSYPVPEPGLSVLPVEGPRWPLEWDPAVGSVMRISDPVAGLTWHFDRVGAAADGAVQTVGAVQLPLVAITDRNDRRIEVLHSELGAPVEVRHPGGYRVLVDTDGPRITGLRLVGEDPGYGDGPRQPVAASDGELPTVRLTGFGYDGNGNLIDVVNSSGLAQRFTYDEAGRITSWTDRNQHRYRYLYDRAGRCVQTRGDGGFLDAVFSYDTERMTTTVADALGHVTLYQLNELSQTVAETDPLGHTTRYTWDRHDRPVTRTDALGQVTAYEYDVDGNIAALVRADGSVTSASYNALHQLIAVTEPDGALWCYDYDRRGNPVTITDPLGAVTRFQHDEWGFLVSVEDPNGDRTVLRNDPAGLPVAVTDALGATTSCLRDGFGRPVQATDPLEGTTTYGWSVEGDLLRRTAADGSTESWRYDGEGNCLEHTDAIGGVSRFEYTFFDLVAARTDPSGARHTFAYDKELRLVQVVNPQGLKWTYAYSSTGDLVSETDFNGRTLGYRRDPLGRLIGRTNGAGQTVDYLLDAIGRTVEQRSDGRVTRFGYDAGDRLSRAVGPDAELGFDYDPVGRLLSESCNGSVLTHAYDAAGRELSRRTPSGVESRWTYDRAGRPLVLAGTGEQIRFGHDLAGRETERRFGSSAVIQTWDAAGRLASQDLTTGAAGTGQPQQPVRRREFSYRPDGFLTAVSEHGSAGVTYALDGLGRVTEVSGPARPERYAYDPAGNIVHADRPATAGSPDAEQQGEHLYAGTLVRRAGRVAYDYDGQGRMITQRRKLLSGGSKEWRYSWDSEDRLVEVTTPDGAVWQYLYDPLGRRIAKRRLHADRSTVTESVAFTWDGALLVEQVHTAGDQGPQRTTTWEYEPGSHRPVAQTVRVGGRDAANDRTVDEQFHAILTDRVGAPTELVDAAGRIAWRSAGTLWGSRYRDTEADSVNCPISFPGQYRDAETGLHYNLYRYYDPEIARYISLDPLGLGGGSNSSWYVPNPTEWTDPLGLALCRPVPRLEDGDLKKGWIHIDARHITGNHPTKGPGDLMPPNTTRDQVLEAAKKIVAKGKRVSDNPNVTVQTFDMRMKVNGMRAVYRVSINSHDGSIITFFPVGKSYRP